CSTGAKARWTARCAARPSRRGGARRCRVCRPAWNASRIGRRAVVDRIPLKVADLDELLTYIAADDRDTWVTVAMGVKAEFGEAGFDAGDRWSQAGDGYKAADAKSVWKSLRKGGIGMGTVIKLARDNGWSPKREPLTQEEKRAFAKAADDRRKARQA